MVKKLISRSEFARQAGVSAAAITKACSSSLMPACDGKRIDSNHPIAIEYLRKKDDVNTPPAATGLDTRYEDAVTHCRETGKYTVSGLQRSLGIPYARAKSIIEMMKAVGLVPAKGEPPPEISKPRTIKGHAAKSHTKKTEALEHLTEGTTIHEVPEDIESFADMTLRELIERFGTDVAFCDWLKATKSIEDINEKRIKSAQLRGELISRDLVKIGIIDPIDSAHKKLLTDVKKTVTIRVMAMAAAGKSQEEVEAFVADQITSILRPTKTKIARTLRNA